MGFRTIGGMAKGALQFSIGSIIFGGPIVAHGIVVIRNALVKPGAIGRDTLLAGGIFLAIGAGLVVAGILAIQVRD